MINIFLLKSNNWYDLESFSFFLLTLCVKYTVYMFLYKNMLEGKKEDKNAWKM